MRTIRPWLSLTSVVIVVLIGASWALRNGVQAQAPAPQMTDATLGVRTAAAGLNMPIGLAFLGVNDMLVIEKDTGRVQRVVNGSVTLNSATLSVLPAGAGGLGKQYVLIANDGVDAVNGTFNGLAEGATVTASLLQYAISYKGGTGNDVVLTQTAVPPSPQITQLTKLPNGQMQITGTGIVGATYFVEATATLGTPNWSDIGSIAADWNGVIKFTDPSAVNFPQRFYRFRMQ